jgi:NADPH-dependent 2,4-dienoyl-CoA reductase/sulfur reductase-like enzyme
VTLLVNGTPVSVEPGSMVSAAVAGLCRESVSGEPRGPLCGIGICFECRVTVNGRPHSRACQTPCEEGMEIAVASAVEQPLSRQPLSPRLRATYDVVVIGAGPAGLAASVRAAECGARVAIVDDNPHPGGQIWRAVQSVPRPEASRWLRAAERHKVDRIAGARVFAAPAPNWLALETSDGGRELKYGRLILATGARERFLPFPGWTLPNVMGAGGLQALVKSGLPIAGKQLVIAGSGPLLLAVAKYMRRHGAQVRLIAEQAGRQSLARFAIGLAAHPAKLLQALELRASLFGIPYLTSCWPIAAHGRGKLESVTLQQAAKTWTVPCDYLACGFGLVPNIELAVLLGCQVERGAVAIDEYQQTSVPGVYCAGESTGIGGVDLALVEGEIAGYAAAGALARAGKRFAERRRHRRFAARLEQAFALRDELKYLPQDATLVCRCEDVAFGRIRDCGGWREAKLHTRCGMGPCQGRVCGSAVEFLLGWQAESVRPPAFPVRVGSLIDTGSIL